MINVYLEIKHATFETTDGETICVDGTWTQINRIGKLVNNEFRSFISMNYKATMTSQEALKIIHDNKYLIDI